MTSRSTATLKANRTVLERLGFRHGVNERVLQAGDLPADINAVRLALMHGLCRERLHFIGFANKNPTRRARSGLQTNSSPILT
jgi:hypothetical protein